MLICAYGREVLELSELYYIEESVTYRLQREAIGSITTRASNPFKTVQSERHLDKLSLVAESAASTP